MFSSACYQYVRVEEGVMPAPGREVRVHLSPTREFEVATTPVPGVEIVEGSVYESEAQSLAVWTSMLRSQFGFSFRANGAVLYVPRDHIDRLYERRHVPGKTVLAIGAGVVALLGIFGLAHALAGGGSLPGEPITNDGRIAFPFPGTLGFGIW
jgi:hypothetical protein